MFATDEPDAKFEETLANSSRPSWRQPANREEREDVLPIKNFTDKLSKLSELSEHTPGPVYISEEVRYFVPSLHKSLTLSWKRRPSDDDVASRSPRQLNPRIVVIEYPDPQCHSWYSEFREASTLLYPQILDLHNLSEKFAEANNEAISVDANVKSDLYIKSSFKRSLQLDIIIL